MCLSSVLLLHDALLHQGVWPHLLDHHGMGEESSMEWRVKGWSTILIRRRSHDGLLSKKLCWDSTCIAREEKFTVRSPPQSIPSQRISKNRD